MKPLDIIDISLGVVPDMPVWPGSVGVRITRTMRLEDGDVANVSRLDCDVHVGTHVDAPRHFLEGGRTVDELDLDCLIGPAVVCHLPNASQITASELSGLDLPVDTSRLLLRTRNSAWWAEGSTEFRKDYVAFTADGAQWLVDHGVGLIGVDYLSVQRYEDSPLTHQVLLEAGVVIIEGLNLTNVPQGTYELICLPLRLIGVEGAPARAVLRRVRTGESRGGAVSS